MNVPSHYVLAGHLHPALELMGRGRQRLKLPCFWFGAACGVLPAFGLFIGGALIRPAPHDKVYAVTDEQVIAI
jgi:uncharacterized protein